MKKLASITRNYNFGGVCFAGTIGIGSPQRIDLPMRMAALPVFVHFVRGDDQDGL